MKARFLNLAAGFALSVSLSLTPALACSRATWLGPDGQVVTGRSMDWPYAFNTHFYLIPRGTENTGYSGPHGLVWTSNYGTVVAAGSMNPGGPINGAFDGVNEKGLGANLLYLAETDFGPMPQDDTPRVSFAGYVQYVLSSFATVAEAVASLQANPVYPVPANFGPGGIAAPSVHLSITDATGDSAVLEWLEGRLVVHHGRQYQVMTNSPVFAKQLTLNDYWSRQDRSRVLPGSHQSEDRFVRASYYLSKLPETTDERKAVAGVLSVMRNVSVPWGEPDPDHPNIAPTYWRTVIDHGRGVYYFESALSPNILWMPLAGLDFSEGSGIRAVKVEDNYQLQGDISGAFVPAEPIRFLEP